MKKLIATLVIVFSLGLVSCRFARDMFVPIATPTVKGVSTPTQMFVSPTLSATPNNSPGKNGELIVTLGEEINRQGWFPAIPAFSPDGKMIALVSEKVRLWDVKTYELIHEFYVPYSPCNSENVAFSTNGKILAASIFCTSDPNSTGHVLVWDTKSGDLLQDWEQKFSITKVESVSNSFPATGLAFLPDSSLLAFANGDAVEIMDVYEINESVVLGLGDEMVASDIGVSNDSKKLFAFMDVTYFESNLMAYKFALQVWDLESRKLIENVVFPEPDNTGFFAGHFDADMELSGKQLLVTDYVKETFSITNLETSDIKNLNYRGDVERYVSQDLHFVIFLPQLDGFDCKKQSIELWDTSVNQNLYTFKTSSDDFNTEWCFGPNTIIFSPNNAMLAIAHEERVSLWDISGFTKPKEGPIP